MTLNGLITNITKNILNPIIGLLFVVATIVFLWGVIQYVVGSQGDEKTLEKGRHVMLWAIIGLTVMASAWGLVGILQTYFGL